MLLPGSSEIQSTGEAYWLSHLWPGKGEGLRVQNLVRLGFRGAEHCRARRQQPAPTAPRQTLLVCLSAPCTRRESSRMR